MALTVKTEELREVARDLLQRKESLNNIYNNSVKRVMEDSKEAINISGLEFNEFNLEFQKAFTELGNRMENLANALQNQILPKYDDLSSSIKSAFNNEFASQMQNLLNQIRG